MASMSTALNALGLILLTHAAYSSYEHSLLTTSTVSINSKSATAIALPTDIVVEALFSTLLLLFGIVLGSPALRPIEWSVWANEAEQDTRRSKGKKRFEGDGGAEGTSMAWLEDRKGFYDVRAKRKEFAEWVREGGKS